MTDARIVRTRAALNRAIIKLATNTPLPSITVSELAAEAGINRVTFYKHFTTPAEALNAALNVELDELRTRFLNGYADQSADPVEIFTESVQEVLDHMDRHRALYQLSIDNPQDGTLMNLLADHFTETLEQYLKGRANLDPAIPDINVSLVSRFFAHGLVGAIKSRVIAGWDGDREQFLQSVIALAPDWWFPTRG